MAEANKAEATKAADTETTTVTTSVAEPAAEEKETKKAEPKKRGRKPAAEKKETTAKKPGRKPGRKPAAEKKETEVKTTTTRTRKAAVKETVHVQFSGKTYSTEDLVKIAKDVWKYDLKKKVGDFKAVELYVKPEESTVYYVINGEETGQFNI